MSAADACKPGDLDPTWLEDDHQPPCPSRQDGWWCTRVINHDGQHIAGTGEEVGAVWE